MILICMNYTPKKEEMQATFPLFLSGGVKIEGAGFMQNDEKLTGLRKRNGDEATPAWKDEIIKDER